MPSWAIHLGVTTKINEKIKLSESEKNIFLLGNILPDILNGHVIKNISHIVPHKEAHIEKPVQVGNHIEYRYDLDGFLEKYKEKFSNPLILGYYTHLLTDFYWNNLTYGQLGIFDENKNLIGIKLNNGKEYKCSKEEIRKIKTNDFKLFSNYIYENKLAKVPKYDEKMLEYAKELTWLDLKKDDILEAIKYLEDMAELKIQLEIDFPDYKIFTQEEMENHLNKCIKFIEEEKIPWEF